jgi:hypothetical protein
MTDQRSGGGLSTIFAIFLGLMVTAFIGVGVYTYYPDPVTFNDRATELDRQRQAIANSKTPEALSPEERARMQQLLDERNKVQDELSEARKAWGRRTSIILITLATFTMAISILGAPQLPVVSNGLLIGGVFTMLYGVGWIIATDTSTARFLVIALALAITLGLGYVRFVRGASSPAAAPAAAPSPSGDLEARVRRLEQRLDEAARALVRSDPPGP